MRIRLETDAYFLILDKIQKNIYELIASPVHYKEIGDISDTEEKYQLLNILKKLSKERKYNHKEARERTEELISLKFGIADAAHIAFAEQAADVFISCDDKLLKKCGKSNPENCIAKPYRFL